MKAPPVRQGIGCERKKKKAAGPPLSEGINKVLSGTDRRLKRINEMCYINYIRQGVER
jgi:hypothetical protein